jgi:hypothetical protein
MGCTSKITLMRNQRKLDVCLTQTSAALLLASEKAAILLDQLQKDVIYMYIYIYIYTYKQRLCVRDRVCVCESLCASEKVFDHLQKDVIHANMCIHVVCVSGFWLFTGLCDAWPAAER